MAQRDDYAVVIGIDRYPYLKPLQGPEQDATAFRKWLSKPEGGDLHEDNVRLILSSALRGDRPVKDEIDAAFDEVFGLARQQAQPARRLYVYFAGHGVSNLSRELSHVALIMANARQTHLNHSLDAPSYHKALYELRLFREQVFFYDCCRERREPATGMPPPWTPEGPDPGVPDPAQFVFFAAGFTRYSYERAIEYSERRGLFTKALLEGLEGQAAVRQGEGWAVTPTSLAPYVHSRVGELARAFGLRQEPVPEYRGVAAATIVLGRPARGPKKLALRLDVSALGASVAGARPVVRDAAMQRVPGIRARRENGQLVLRLPPGFWTVDYAGRQATVELAGEDQEVAL